MGRRYYVAIALLLLFVLCGGAHPADSPPAPGLAEPRPDGTTLVEKDMGHVNETGNDGEHLLANDTVAEEEHLHVNTTTAIEEDEKHAMHVNETVTEKDGEHLLVNKTENAEGHMDVNKTLELDAVVDHPDDTTVTDLPEDVNTTTMSPTEELLVTTVAGPRAEEGRRPKQAEGGRRSGAPCPCDEDFGLRCSPDAHTCQGPLSLEVSEVGARSVRVRWRSSAGLEPQAQVSIAPAHGTFTKVQGGVGGTGGVSVGGLVPGQAYWVRVEEDGRHEAAQFTTTHEPKVLVRALGPSSLTVAWDDFRPPSHDSHYLLLYKKEEADWQQVQAGTRTMVTLSGLDPDSAYEVRVAAWEGGRQVDASEQVTARTQDGCVWEGRSMAEGEALPKRAECGEECSCAGGNRTRCTPRCAAPLFLRTTPPLHDPSCYEAPTDGDPCCAQLRCPESKFYGDEGGSAHNKSGECPDLVSDSSCLSDCDRDTDCADHLKCCPSACGGALCVPPAQQPCDHVVCGPNAECSVDDGACKCDHGFQGDPHDLDQGCQPVREGGTEAPFHLDLASEEENFHLNDNVTSRTALSDGCVFGNASFPRGARFEAGCEARCVCEGRGRVTCAPRCRLLEEPASGCSLRPDPEDPDCCTLAVCAFPGVRVVSVEALSGSAVRVRVDPPSSPVHAWVRSGGEWVSAGGGATDKDGTLEVEGLQPATDYELRVTHNNATSNTVHVKTLPPGSSAGACVHEGRPLAVGEELEVGCEHRCVCREGGLLECRDRCQVWVDAVGLEGCEWRPAPDDPCCTVPVCHSPNLLPFPTGGIGPGAGGGARCEGEGGASYRAGDIWESGDGCRTTICRCGAQGVQCTSECPPPPRCPGPLVTNPECPCPVCAAAEHHPHMPPTTASPRACEFRGVPYAVGAEFRDGCAARCVCGADLRVQCEALQCPPPPEGCLEWDEGGDDPCCPKCKESGCVSEGVRRRPSSKWEEGGRECECLTGGRVRCCPRVPPRFLAPTERCPRPVVVTPDDPQMCPYVVCNNTAHGGGEAPEEEEEMHKVVEELRAVSIVALNSTAVRVRFSLPPSLVGARGHAELRFSPSPSLLEAEWRAARFSRPRRLFDSPHIEYVLGAGLDPSHTYYMRVRVRPDPPLPAPHDSALFKVTMPQPAAVTVDVRPLRAHPSPGGRSARVTWRPLAPRERRLVDALLLQWKRERDEKWEETPPLHRDTHAWELHSLQPASTYELRLILRGEEGTPTLVASPGNTLRFNTTNATEEEPSVVASIVKVDGNSASFSVSPLPQEEEVRAARVRWGGGGGFARSSYTAPPNASQPAVLEGLAPNTKYWAQLDLFLADGRALTSNRVEFKTADNVVSQEARSTEDGAGGGVGALVAVAVVCGAAALAFALLLVVVVRRRGAAAPISRTPSEAAYDNPTYKTYDGERPDNTSRENTLPLEK